MAKNILLLGLCVLFFTSCDVKKTDESDVLCDESLSENDCINFMIPFELIEDRIVVKCKLNGKIDVKLAVDNACSELYLTDSFAKRYKDSLSLTLYPESLSGGNFMANPFQECYPAEGNFFYQFGDSIFVNYYDKVFRAVAGKRLMGDHAMIIVENPSQKFLPDGVDGIIPMRCFAKYGMVGLNYAKDRFEFDIKGDSSMTVYPCEYIDNKQIIKFPFTFFSNMGDSVNYVFNTIIDLGNRTEFLITNSSNSNKIIDKLIAFSNKSISSVYANTPEYSTYNFKQVKIGNDHTLFKNVEFLYLRDSKKINLFDMLMGIRIILKYYVIFDYANNLIYMKPFPNNKNRQEELDSYILASIGLNVNRSKSGEIMNYYIAIVDNDRKNVDVQLFDTIIKIDDVETKGLEVDSIRKLMVSKSVPHKKITIKRGNKLLILSRNK